MVMVALLGSAAELRAATLTAMWDANTEPNVAGYSLSYGTQSGTYTTTLDVGQVTSYQMDLPAGQRYYFVVRAYSTTGEMSPPSAEVVADVAGPATPPSITSLSPTAGTVGTAVTIAGSNFGSTQGSSSVRFNGTAATPTSWSNTAISVPVPAGATTGPVVVAVGSANSNGVTFTVTASSQPPAITTLSPTSGAVGTSVTITGTNFGATQGASTVRFNGTLATPTSWSATSIVATVPSGATTGAVVVTVGSASSNGVTFTVSSSSSALPAPWQTQDVGAPSLAGSATHNAGTFTVAGAGTDIWSASDQFRFVYQPLDGDGEIVARVASEQNVDAWTKVGVMMRQDVNADSPHAFVAVTPGAGLVLQSRPTRGAMSTSSPSAGGAAPQWVRLVRAGNTLTGYVSVNGSAWTSLGSVTVAMPPRIQVGLAVTSHNTSTRATADFTNVSFNGAGPANQAPTLTQPANQTTVQGTAASLQLAATDPEGAALTYSATGLPGGLSVNASSGLISGTVSGSATTYSVTATASDGTSSNSKTFTWTVTASSQPPAITTLSPTSGAVGTSVTITGTSFGATQGSSTVRFNGTLATPTSWSATSIVAAVPSGATTGAVVVTVGGTSSNGVTFTVSSSSSALPAPWQTQDVGAPSLAGSATHNAGTFTVAGAGTDIWSASDQFRFVYQPLDGDGEIVARVASEQNVDAWTKVGVMMRQDVNADSPHAFVAVTPGAGLVLQARATRGAMSTSSPSAGGAAPQWVRLVRAGNTLTGYVSVNGSAWTSLGSVTVAMPPRIQVGLAVTSHNTSTRATADFTNVSFNGAGPANQAPTLTQPANQTTVQGAAASLQLAATDPEGAALIYSATGLPGGLSVNASSGLISGTVSGSATTYSVTATASDGTSSDSKTFTWTVTASSQPPAITTLSPTSGAVGTSVTITGTNFGATQGSSTVRFNGTLAAPTSWSDTAINVPVPSGATTGAVVVAVGSASSNGVTFTVTASSQPPAITTLSPTSGAVGTPVTITGTNFGATQGSSTVRFNGTLATPTSWSATSIVAAVPSGATSGAVVVTVGSASSNGVTFTVSTSSSALPAPWQTQDVGAPSLAGSATHNAGTFTVAGAGTDIWSVTDQFRFVYQPLDGDGEIVARVAGLQSVEGWTKAGVMIRETLSADSANAAALVTGSYGITLQMRTPRATPTSNTSPVAGSAPQWVRLVRTGNTFVGYYSVSGTTWTQMGSVTIQMTPRVYIGLAITSHNTSARATADFSDVAVSSGAAGAMQTAGMAESKSTSASTARKATPTPVVNDYDGDGKSDLASVGSASILTSSSGFSATIGKASAATTGVSVPGDYDGDGKADIATYRAATGTWSVLTSSSDFTTGGSLVLGTEGDVPVPGDYDGDGITDAAVYSPATGQWQMLAAGKQAPETVSLWGTVSDVPVPGDYDGDGKTDPAIYNAATGQWKVLRSSTGLVGEVTMVLGTSGDVAMPADYDGDGITDAAVYSPSTGTWKVRPSSNSAQVVVIARHGTKTDVPATGDYDGDGKADLAVLHAGTWQVLYSSTGYASGVAVAGRPSAPALTQRP